ncbi:MAG: hypothetical protein AAF821_25830 [Cyanobacteria bacterium P01_D01_bin.156]
MRKTFWFVFLLFASIGLLVHYHFWQIPADQLQKEDMYYIWLEGKRIATGENPYARVLAGNLRENDKYATYFPVAYLFSALAYKLGIQNYCEWLYIWRPISFACHMGIVGLTLGYFQRRGLWLMGVATASILLLGRWSLYIIRVHHLEFAAILCLVLSLVLLQSRTKLALLLFGTSLGIKQIAIFLLPLYLIWLWRHSASMGGQKRIQELAMGVLLILVVPCVTSLPFLLWNAEGFLKSVLFSATRLAGSHVDKALSLDAIFSQDYPWIVGLRAKLPMLALMGLLYLSFLTEKVGLFLASVMTMATFVYFNSVLFLQYFIWPLSLMPFALVEGKAVQKPN